MAYENDVQVRHLGDDRYQVLIDETDTGTTDEAEIPVFLDPDRPTPGAVPAYGRVVRQKCILSSGTATTVDPVLGRTTNPTGRDVEAENDTPAAIVDNTDAGIAYAAPSGLFHRSQPDAGADNVIASEYLLIADWA